jgi:hypothetical protein
MSPFQIIAGQKSGGRVEDQEEGAGGPGVGAQAFRDQGTSI